MDSYDVIIIGAGAAGLSAALYSARMGMKTLVLTKALGGQTVYTSEIENYLGFEKISGPDLTHKFVKHVESQKVEIKYELVTKIEGGLHSHFLCLTFLY